MTDDPRSRILARLRGAPRQEAAARAESEPAAPAADRSAMIARLKSLMGAVKSEVHVVPAAEWMDRLKDILRQRKFKDLLFAPGTPLGASIARAWQEDAGGLPELVPYAGPVEDFKPKLFEVAAAITATEGAVAETGALILKPSAEEPRLMSLVPPVHIAVLFAEDIVFSLGDAMAGSRWPQAMPTNMLLVSGPSKTADIELVLAFGVHGPKELIVLVLE
jgi:L-lactate dehydrogenase complex protein LldG